MEHFLTCLAFSAEKYLYHLQNQLKSLSIKTYSYNTGVRLFARTFLITSHILDNKLVKCKYTESFNDDKKDKKND
jgi:hypothetical protein